MKILMPYVDIAGKEISNPVISGGTELFSRLVYNNFDVEVINIPWNTTSQENRYYKNLIISTAFDKKCDLILSNNIKSVCFNNLKDIGIPVMHITHTNYGLLKANTLLNDFESFGHSVYGVSQANIDYMINKCDRLGEQRVNYSGIISPAFCSYDLPVESSPNKNIVTIGRANSYKNPFMIHRLLKHTGYVPKVITSIGNDEDSIEYYGKNKHLSHDLNLDHKNVMEILRTSSCSIITCIKETFGISALESLSVGTPILINTGKSGTHASSEIAGHPSHFKLITRSDNIESLLSDLVKVDRIEIKQATQDKHSKKNWVNNLSNAFDQTVEKYKQKSKNSVSIESFFE